MPTIEPKPLKREEYFLPSGSDIDELTTMNKSIDWLSGMKHLRKHKEVT